MLRHRLMISSSSASLGVINRRLLPLQTMMTTNNTSLSSSLSSVTVSSKRFQIWCLEPPSTTWMCPDQKCLTANIKNMSKCNKCGSKKPSIICVPLGHWQCPSCSTSNPKNVKFCRECATSFNWPKSWKCPCCQNSNPTEKEPKGGIANFNPFASATLDPSKAIPTSPQCNFCEWNARPKGKAQQMIKEKMAAAAASSGAGQGSSTGLDLLTTKDENHAVSNNNKDNNTEYCDQVPQAQEQQTIQGEGNPSSTLEPNQNQNQNQPPPAAADEDDDLPPSESLGAPGFPWLCRNKSCGAENAGTNPSCQKCGWNIWPSDWMCSGCGASNFKMRSQCFNCTSPIQPYWHCKECRTNTSIYQKRCRKCNVDRPEPKGGAKIVGGGGANNNNNAIGGKAGSGQGDWVCAVCHKFNYARRNSCFSCETPRGGTADGQPTVAEITPVGDSNWRCHICSALNFRSRGDCWQCHTTKQQNFGVGGEMQIQEGEDTAPKIEREGFQQDKRELRKREMMEKMMATNNMNEDGGQNEFDDNFMSTNSIAEQEQQRKVERRRKALEHAAGWSGNQPFNHGRQGSGGMFHPPGSSSIGGGGGGVDDFVDDGHDWLCAKCMRKNQAGSTECARCFSPKTVAPGSRALTALNAEKKKKIFKI